MSRPKKRAMKTRRTKRPPLARQGRVGPSNNAGGPKTAAATLRLSLTKGRLSVTTALLVILILILLGAFPAWPHARNWGYGPSGIVGLLLVVLLVLMILQVVPAPWHPVVVTPP